MTLTYIRHGGNRHNAKKLSTVPKMAKVYNKKRGRLFSKLLKAYKAVPRFHAKGKSVTTKKVS